MSRGWLDQVDPAPVVEGQFLRDLSIFLPAEDELKILVVANRAMGIVIAKGRLAESPVVVRHNPSNDNSSNYPDGQNAYGPGIHSDAAGRPSASRRNAAADCNGLLRRGLPVTDQKGESGHFYFGENRTSVLCSDMPKTQLIWNDRCQHLDLTWRRPGGARRDRFDDESL